MSFLEDTYAEMGEILEGEFSQSVLIEVGTASADLNCIFNKTYEDVDADGLPIQSNAPMLGLDKIAVDSKLGVELVEGPNSYATISGVKYKIKRIEPDGTGFVRVLLKNPIP